MFYLKFGDSKKCIVFLHGWGADLNSFLWAKDYFSEFSLLFVDFPGFGKSPEPNEVYSVEDYASELKSLIDENAFEEIVLVGHSFGGRVAIKFAFLYQDCYLNIKLFLIDSAGVLPKRTIKYRFNVWRFKRCKKKALSNEKYKKKLEDFGSNDFKQLSSNMKKTFVCVVNEDLFPQAKKIKSETILLWGEKDKETKLYMAKKLHKAIKNSQLYVIKNAGHFSFLDNKKAFLILLDRFVKNK